MKSFTKIFAILLTIGAITFACQPENVAPKSDAAGPMSAAADDDHPTPDPQCSQSYFFDLVNGAGSPTAPSTQGGQDYGSIEVANDAADVWVIATAGPGWRFAQDRIYLGLAANVPLNTSTNPATIATEQFPSTTVNNPVRTVIARTLTGVTSGCPDIVFWATINRLSPFGAPINSTVVWGAGVPFYNGWVMSGYCWNPCALWATSQSCLYGSTPGTCRTLSVTNTNNGGVGPWTVTWSNGATGMTNTVCPNVTTTYYAYCVDQVLARDTFAFTVCVGGANCPCAPPPVDPPSINASCMNILTGLPSSVGGATCATLTAYPTGQVAMPVTYTWSNGTTGATTQACAAGTYTVTITDANGSTASASVTISAINIRCGNTNGNNGAHKVIVCHKPPGNPANVQEICIDWSGVPAHVALYRPPYYNPNMGHDSGCSIGPCGIAACGTN